MKKKPVVKEYLKCTLTNAEKLAVGEGLARAQQKLRAKQEELKEVQAQVKAEIAKVEADIGLQSSTLANGYEYRNVDCEVRFHDPKQGMKTLVRLDTGEMLQPTRMNSDECQVHLFEQAIEEEEQPA